MERPGGFRKPQPETRTSAVDWPIFWAVFLALVAAGAIGTIWQGVREQAQTAELKRALGEREQQASTELGALQASARAAQRAEQRHADQAAAQSRHARQCDLDSRVLTLEQLCSGGYVVTRSANSFEQAIDLKGHVARCDGRTARTPLREVPGCPRR